MRLHEYQAKLLFAELGIPVPAGEFLHNPDAAEDVAGRYRCRHRCRVACVTMVFTAETQRNPLKNFFFTKDFFSVSSASLR
jgi:hypothetical protein